VACREKQASRVSPEEHGAPVESKADVATASKFADRPSKIPSVLRLNRARLHLPRAFSRRVAPIRFSVRRLGSRNRFPLFISTAMDLKERNG
jgi:hypothetical protein